ncbi:hypothetical protein HYU13_02345 [Candidatus Woesearchaeota archaeon]|nr:hypothetical protein [Candidatus Woesearchaeota archaeon]
MRLKKEAKMAGSKAKMGRMLFLLIGAMLASIIVEGALSDRVKEAGSVAGGILPVIVNTLAITGFIYILLTLLEIKLDAVKSQAVLLIFIGVVVLMLTLAPVFNAPKGGKLAQFKKTPFFWNYNLMKTPKFFLFGTVDGVLQKDNKGEAMGVLKSPKRMGIFIGALLVFYLLFSKVKLQGDVGKLNAIMSFIIAYNMAVSPKIGVEMVIGFGELVFGWIFYDQLKGSFGEQWGKVIAIIFVIIMATITFPDQKGLGGLLVWMGEMGVSWAMKWIIVLVVPYVLLWWGHRAFMGGGGGHP